VCIPIKREAIREEREGAGGERGMGRAEGKYASIL
jgi:hypothetical protein